MSSSFPMPLTEEDEISCLEKLSSGDMSARETLIKHNLRLVAHIAKSIQVQVSPPTTLSPSAR